MIEFLVKAFEDHTADVEKAVQRADMRALQKAAYQIFKDAQSSIEQSDKPSPAGQPPHSRKGQLKRAIRYSVEKSEEMAVIGPRESEVGTSAEPEEFGGEYKGSQYPKRSFMGPALQRNISSIPSLWSAEVHN
jgi:hypothetical protein